MTARRATPRGAVVAVGGVSALLGGRRGAPRGGPHTDRERVRGPSRDRDRGSASVLVLALVAVTVALATLLGLLASAHAARGRAQAAADLAALAGAQRALTGGAACGLAREVAARNGAGLDRCHELPGAVVEVAASVSGVWGVATAAARAGPRATT